MYDMRDMERRAGLVGGSVLLWCYPTPLSGILMVCCYASPTPATPPHIAQHHTIETVCSGYPEMTDLTDFRVLLCSVQGRQDVEESVVWR